MPLVLDGRKAREAIAERLRAQMKTFPQRPLLAIVQAGERAESNAYIERKKKFAEGIGAAVRHIRLPEAASEREIIAEIEKLNADPAADGVIVQLPLPELLGGSEQRIIDSIAPEKDVDGLTSANAELRGKSLLAGDGKRSLYKRKNVERKAVIPATARGIVELLEYYQIPILGKKAAVLGRSALVGAPTAEYLRKKGAHVTVCHSRTPNTQEITRSSDIIVAAIGKPKLVGREYFRADKTQVVIDVGITSVTERGAERLEEEIPRRKLVGDVDFERVKGAVAAISPVPGGVGPMTVAALFENLTDAAAA